jgi:HEAT repeat protein
VTLAERLRSTSLDERRAAIAELAARGRATPEDLQALADCLDHPRKAIQRPAAEAFAALARGGVQVEDVLRAALRSAEPRRRWGGAFAWALRGEPPAEALPAVLETLGSDDGDLRWAAAGILARMTDRAAVIETLRDLLARGGRSHRKMALYCLRDFDARAPEVERAALAALDDEDARVRIAAVSAVARLAGDRSAAAARLLRVLEEGDAPLRRAAAAALGTLGEPREDVLAALRRSAAAADQGLRRAAERSLRLLAEPRRTR